MPFAVVTIVRHGETAHNAAKIIQGWLDTPLNAQGEAQGRVVARYLASEVAFHEAWSSDLDRAKKTGKIIVAEQAEEVELQTEERIRERYLGALQGTKVGSVDRTAVAHTIEPKAKLVARLFSFWDSILPPTLGADSSTSDEPRQILVVSHGGSIRALCAALLLERRATYTIATEDLHALENRVGNCSVTQFAMEKLDAASPWRGRLVRYADDNHFVDSSRVPSPSENVDVID